MHMVWAGATPIDDTAGFEPMRNFRMAAKSPPPAAKEDLGTLPDMEKNVKLKKNTLGALKSKKLF